MPDVTSIDLSGPKRRDDEDEERLRDQAAANEAQHRASLDAGLKLAHGDPDKQRELVQKQQGYRRRDEDEQRRLLASNDSTPQRPDDLDATAPDARRALNDHMRHAVLDAGGPTLPADAPVGTPVLDLSGRADMMTRQQVETQIALTKQALASFGVMSNPVVAAQFAMRLDALRQRQVALSPPMPNPKTFPDAGALWREQGKQQRFLDSAEGKQATPEERDAHARYAARLGHEAEARITAWQASPEGQEFAKRKLYESIHKLDPHSVCRAGDTVDSLRAQYTKLVADKTPPAPNPDTTIYMGARGDQGTLDELARKDQIARLEAAQTEANAIHGGPLGTAFSLAGRALHLSDEARTALAAFGGLGDQFALHYGGMRGRGTESVRDAVFAGEQSRAGRSPGEITSLNNFFTTNASPLQYWGDTMDGFDPSSKVSVLSEDLPAVRYFSDPTKARGMWLTDTPVEDPQRDFALPPGNTAVSHKEWVIPAGTLVLRGTCAPLNDQPGGGSQIFIADPKTLREP